ncbi:hypothetical protein N7466_004330 [Penicillium verhagenii]|uniref:uncharacterized protein n=1 Tax=Penicillium verhagenii TaxID=1562060 RepID=UPI0025455EB2|nr:uncharacterized protein N7466_004330 [Penicillium verhagenii]KAJ5934783.1 hypothetical protein N7466_004330 [Penicillium verhagenii]
MKSSSTSPFLMNELLALAATHISIQRPSERSIYRHHATQLQNHALASFNNAQNSEEPEGYMCRFIFSSMLGVHMLCDTLHFRDPDFTLFLDSFTHYLRIHCGVRSVMRNKWQALNETALGPVLRDGELRLQSKTNDGLGPECSRLLGLVERSNLGPSITATYHTAIESLQMAFNSVSSTDSPRGYCVGVVSWPATLSSEYIDLLTRRSPDALAILAHYAVILHHHRNLWLFGDGGRYLIQSISEFLGPGWAEWVAFPNHALSEPTTPMSHLT